MESHRAYERGKEVPLPRLRDLAPADGGTGHAMPQAVVRRLRSLDHREVRLQQPRTFTPRWLPAGLPASLPGLIVAQWSRGDAFGCSQQIAELDLAFRRAGALHVLFREGVAVDGWPRPIRPERGGLQLLDAQNGSLDVLWTFYGTLVSVATSTPVTLASFASLA